MEIGIYLKVTKSPKSPPLRGSTIPALSPNSYGAPQTAARAGCRRWDQRAMTSSISMRGGDHGRQLPPAAPYTERCGNESAPQAPAASPQRDRQGGLSEKGRRLLR